MANEISGNRGAGQPPIGTTTTRGVQGAPGLQPPSKINEADGVTFSHDLDDEPAGPVNQASNTGGANGAGITSGGVFSPTSGFSGFGQPGMQSGGVLVSPS